jgi:pilus assembly protein CpaB
MDNRRVALALVIALVVSAGATFLFYSKVKGSQSAKPQTTKVVAAKDVLRAGTQLSADNVALIDWPQNITLQGSYTKIEDVVGRPLIQPVAANQPILESSLALPGSGLGLTVRIPEGMRAISVSSNAVVGVAGFLYPGSHVDVLVTYRPPDEQNPITQTVLQNVEVLSAGQKIEADPQGKPETVGVVTLLLNPVDSEKLVLATSQGTIHFVLRNGVDTASTTTPGITVTELMTGKPKLKPPVIKKVAKVTKPANFYVVETISGTKKSTEKFEEPHQ